MYLEQGGLETTHCEGTLQLHFDLLWRNKSKSRKYALLWKPCRHLISTFLWIIRWIHLPWKSPSSEISWQSETVPSQHVWALKEPCLDCSLMVWMLPMQCSLLPITLFFTISGFIFYILWLLPSWDFFFSKKNDKNDPHKSIREVVK